MKNIKENNPKAKYKVKESYKSKIRNKNNSNGKGKNKDNIKKSKSKKQIIDRDILKTNVTNMMKMIDKVLTTNTIIKIIDYKMKHLRVVM